MRKLLCVAALALLAAAPAKSATLEILSGKVSVNTGGGYKQVTTLTNLNGGDSVLVEAGSSANIVFDNGCTVSLGGAPATGRSIVTVPNSPPCSPNAKVADIGSPAAGPIVTGVVIAGAIAGGVVLAVNASDSKPSSP